MMTDKIIKLPENLAIKDTEEYKELYEINKKMHALDDFDNRLDTQVLDSVANWLETAATKLNTWAVQVRFANTKLPSELRTSELDVLKKDIEAMTQDERTPKTYMRFKTPEVLH